MQVGEMRVMTLPGTTFGGDRERRLQVLVRAEGPTCVLSVTDLVVRPWPLCKYLSLCDPACHAMLLVNC